MPWLLLFAAIAAEVVGIAMIVSGVLVLQLFSGAVTH